MKDQTPPPLSADILLAIKNEVAATVSEKTSDDRLFIRQQLERLAKVAKYVGIGIVAVVAVLGIKTAGDLHSVAEKLVISTIEKKDPAEIYRRSIEQLYAQILLGAGLSGQSKDTDTRPILTDTEYNHVLTSLQREDDNLRISFDQGVLLLSRAPPLVWNRSAAVLLNALATESGGKNWVVQQPDRAKVVLDAFISTKYFPAISRLRSLAPSSAASPEIRERIIKLAHAVKDKDSVAYVERAFRETQDDRVKDAAVSYLIDAAPTSRILSQYLEELLRRPGEIYGNAANMERLSHYCKLEEKNIPSELRANFEALLGFSLREGMISANIWGDGISSLHHRMFDTKDEFRAGGFRELGELRRPASSPGRLLVGLVAKGGGTVHSWPFAECAKYTLSALASELRKEKFSEVAKRFLLELAANLSVDDGAIVANGLMVRVLAAEMSDQKEFGEGLVWMRLSKEKGGGLTARAFDGTSFAKEIPLRGLPWAAIRDIAFVRVTSDRRSYLVVEQPFRPTSDGN
jgi:hypothetical protein